MTSFAEPSVVIVSGCPGTGKTTLARGLARLSTRGVHLVADEFFSFLAHPIAPAESEARAQNETVMRAVARASGVYARGGYLVFVDGVIGPWFLDVFREELEPSGVKVHYVVLRAGLALTIARATSREAPVTEAVIRAMHAQFAELGALERNAIDTTDSGREAVLSDVRARLDAGRFALDSGI